MKSPMTIADKKIFDYLNQSSYLLRLMLEHHDFYIQPVVIMNERVWHVFYRETVIGTITFRTDESGYTYCNIRLYRYIKSKLTEIKDFIMSEYFIYDGDEKKSFNFDKFDKYIGVIKEIIDTENPEQESKPHTSIEDSISRLTEYCEEYDNKFSKNMMVCDIMSILKENERLHDELQKKSQLIFDTFLNI